MGNWRRILGRHQLPFRVKVLPLIVILGLPIIGSRSIGGSFGSVSSDTTGAILTYDLSPDKSIQELGTLSISKAANDLNVDGDESSKENSDNILSGSATGSGSNPCALASMSLDGKLSSFEEKSLITVSHHVFDVAQGIVPNIMYKVDLEIPPEHEFSLEYWLNGVVEEKSRLKRRHQRDHRGVLELYFNSSSSQSVPEQVLFCSKSSLGGQNKDTSPLLLSFNWFINGNNFLLPSNNGLPSNIIFRLRFTPIVGSLSPVFEQNFSVVVRPECSLVMKIHEATQLTLDSLWNPQTDNKGVNCTVLLLPRVNFGLEIRIINFSIYGMRDICKGRYLTFSRTKQAQHSTNSEHTEIQSEFPSYSFQISPLGRKFCGKLEDYSTEERLLTFIAPESPSSTKPQPLSPSLLLTKSDFSSFLQSQGESSGSISNDDTNLSENNSVNSPYGIVLKVNLPSSVKSRETFNLDISSLSPCQRVVLRGMDGDLKYSKSMENLNLPCSIVIHVPYGNKIITKMTLSRFSEGGGATDPDFEAEGEESEMSTRANDGSDNNHYSNSNNNANNSINYNYNYNNYNDSDLDIESGERVMTNSVPRSSYECPLNFDEEYSTSPSANRNSDNDDTKKFMVIRGEDIESGSEFIWCFLGSSDSQTQHKRAWKSSGNKVKISFQLNYFDVFHLTYQTLKVLEISGECEQGWVSVDGRCVVLVETVSSWTSAEENCQLRGGHLATVSSEQEEQKFQKIITESALFHPTRAYWIGANDRESEGSFQWASGLPFSYKNWFLGWTPKRNEISNIRPDYEGWSDQDCVEIRQMLNPSGPYSGNPLSSLFWSGRYSSTKSRDEATNIWSHSRFYWNDRNCEAKNFYICEKATNKHYEIDYSCNSTLELSPTQTTPLIVSSPAYPSSYPDNIVCITMIETPPGYRIVVAFDEFVLEQSLSCQYDAVELSEVWPTNGTSIKNSTKRICGDWTKRLKLLRYKTSSGTSLSIKFESDFSHHFGGFKANTWAEKDVSGQCSDQQMKKFGSYCYLPVSFPVVNWVTAQHICSSLQGKLASVVSVDEWKFLSQSLPTTSRYDKKSTFWIGGTIDQNSQLVWSDRMPFNFSAFHSSDLQTISDWKCLRVYHHDGGKTDFAWRLADCGQLSGYVCKKKNYVAEARQSVNKTYSASGGKQTSPNFPSNYYNNVDYGYHLVAPQGTQIVIRFSHLDIEDQVDCLYDYVEIIDRKTKNSTRYCGTYTTSELDKLDYVSSSNEVDVFFHSDFSDTKTGFEIAWRAVDVASCISGKTILTGLGGNGFPIQDAMIHSPNFPHFNLPNLNCVYTIVAPAGQRIWLSFPIFEMGQSNFLEDDCLQQDHVTVDLDAGIREDGDMSNDNEITLCGNLTQSPYRTSFMSLREKIRIRVISPVGKSGRGFLGRFKAVPGQLVETLNVATTPNSSTSLTSINYPMSPPENINVTVAFTSPPNYVLTVNINGTSSCPKTARSYLEIRDPYHGTNGTTWKLCQLKETTGGAGPPNSNLRESINLVNGNENSNSNVNNKMGRNEISLGITQMNTAISFRSTFNRLDIRQVYSSGFSGKEWSARIFTTLDEHFRAKVLADGDRLLKLDGCINSPCANGGSCVSENGKHICRCSAPFTGPFCGLSLCDLNPCLFGDCILREKSIQCMCQLGYGGERCDRRMLPCDGNRCSGHGNCIEVNKTSYKCMCHAWWEGPQCESRMLIIPYKPLSQRVLEEPFWLGLITVTAVLGIIGLIWCLKRHFPEKLEKLLNEDLDKNRGISWVSSGRSPSFRTGGGSSLGIRDPIPGTSQQAASPPTSRSFLGRFGIRKPSLLSLSSATSNISGAGASPHTYENRTFSLDDLLRPSRSMMRTPSPHRRRNYSVQIRRDPGEKQKILQQLVSGGGSSSLDGEYKPSTPKPTLSEIIQMSERRLRLASASSMQSEAGSIADGTNSNKQADTEETSFTTNANSSMSQAAIKAEKKVTFARMLDKLAASEMTSSSSCSDVSCGEDTKMVVVAPKPQTKKDRKGRFRRSKAYHRGRNSETDQDCMDMSSSDTTPDPIYTPRLPTRLCISPTGLGTSGNASNTLSLGSKNLNPKIPKIGSADSLLALFRRFSGSNSAPPSPQYSENEESSAGATPLSTPSSPRNSSLQLSIRPPALLITSVPEPNNTIELPVIDPFAQSQGWRAPPATSITLEVPMRDYCLSPIHEVPTPLATPSHSPCHTPMMRRSSVEHLPSIKIQHLSSEDDNTNSSSSSSNNTKKDSPPARKLSIPVISILIDDEDGNPIDIDAKEVTRPGGGEEGRRDTKIFQYNVTGESEVIPDVLIHVPPDACVESQPESESPIRDIIENPLDSPRLKTRPPPLIFANEILSCNNKDSGDDDRNIKIIVPVVSIEYATPVMEHLPKFPSGQIYNCSPGNKTLAEIIPSIIAEHSAYNMKDSPLAPPMITINQSSEAESDSDTPAQRHHLTRPNLCFLSPFAGSDRIPSESNLSTSGYSSMASPCPSRCPSISPLCPSEAEDYHACSHLHTQRRSSFTPGTPKKVPMTPRRSSLNTPQLASGLLCDNSDKYCESKAIQPKDDGEVETDSAVEVETDVDCTANMSEIDNPPMSPKDQLSLTPIMSEDMKYINALLQVPKKGMPKSHSLDINVPTTIGPYYPGDGNSIPDARLDKKCNLRGLGPSLDSKLNSIESSTNGSNGVTIVFPLSTSASNLSGRKNGGNLIEIPEEKERRLSPVSSRSESPLSELSAAGCFSFLGSPLTDSDGVYDCGSSEVPSNNNETDPSTLNRLSLLPLSRLNPRRTTSGRKRDRRMIRSNNRLSLSPSPLNTISDQTIDPTVTSASSVSGVSHELLFSLESQCEASYNYKQSSHLDLPPNLARDMPNSVSPKRVSPKRRVRAQPNRDASSSSSESLASSKSRPRSRTSLSSLQNSRATSRNNSPLPIPHEDANFSTNANQPLTSPSRSLEESIDVKSLTTPKDSLPSGASSSRPLSCRLIETVCSPVTPAPRKISRLRTISHQIRFLRRLELSLIRKKECLTHINQSILEGERRESILSRSDSAEDSSRCETSDTTSTSSESCSEGSVNGLREDNEKPLLSSSSTGAGTSSSGKSTHRKRKGKVAPLSILENISARDFLDSHKKRIRKYK